MSLKNIQLELMYDSSSNPGIRDFYNSTLSNAKRYDRSIGYFSSSILKNYFIGLRSFVLNGGKMRMITSPKLSEEDIEAIKLGTSDASNLIIDNVFDYLKETDENSVVVNQLFAKLLQENILEIKVAYVGNDHGIFHEKLGLIYDENDDFVSFLGSNNETNNAIENNYESFNVFASWIPVINQYAIKHKNNFERHWDGQTRGVKIYDIEDALKNKLLQAYDTKKTVKDLYDSLSKDTVQIDDNLYIENDNYYLPKWYEPRNYQNDAVKAWVDNGYKGLLEMATGSGKTLTSLYAITKLWNNEPNTNKLTIITVPYMLLVNQWEEDVKEFTANVLKVSSEYASTWPQDLNTYIRQLNRGILRSVTVITTMDSLKTDKFQKIIDKCKVDIIFLFDECHNAGAGDMISYLDKKYKYRLGLSATPDRFEDEEGTKEIYEYFDRKVYQFSLKDAIDNKFLVPYNYYPKIVHLDETEITKYNKLTDEIVKALGTDDEEKLNISKISHSVKLKLINRSKIISGAKDKMRALYDIIEANPNLQRTIVYCGSTYVYNDNGENEEENQIKQIDSVCQLLGNKFGKWPVKYTSNENLFERKFAIDEFRNGHSNYLVAIKCLDEGANIPEIENAIILSSTRNPKEFIQRRGRVLRKCDKTGKEYADIYDMIVLPSQEDNTLKSKRLIINELKRFYEFMSISLNKEKVIKLFDEIMYDYGVLEEELFDE